jgi:mannose/fructose/N-acetylgalactosamine-specific phosphotransferase system component IIC
MTPDATLLLALALLGGLAVLDGTSLGQFMVSRPLVAAALGGLAAGAPEQGIVAGLLLESVQLAVLPVGASRYPEAAPGAVAAGAVFAASDRSYAVLLAVVVFALAWEWLCGLSVLKLRQWNARFAVATGTAALDAGEVERRQAAAIGVDFVRGALLTALGAVLLAAGVEALDLSAFPEEWARLALGFAAVAALASGLRLFGRRRWPLFVGGAALGALVTGIS